MPVLSRSSSSSDFITSFSSSESTGSITRKRFSESDKENDENGLSNRQFSFDLDALRGQSLLCGSSSSAKRTWGFQEARRNTTEDSDYECADTESDSDDVPFYVETEGDNEVPDSAMHVETPVKGMAELKINSPVPESPYRGNLFGRSPVPPDSPYVRMNRGSTSLDFKTSLQERERVHFSQEVAKCVEATLDPEYLPFLPLLPKTSSRLNCISPQTVADLVNNKYSHRFDSIVIIDCRYDYEFEGGHIKGAVNCPSPEKVDELFVDFQPSDRICFIFHCEFSSHRGPKGYTRVRSADRHQNINRYPALHFPEMYLLEGGYKAFFEEFQELCHPPAYVPMREEAHRDALRTSQGAFKKKPGSGSSLLNSKRFLSKSCSNIFEGMAEDDELFAASPKKPTENIFGDSSSTWEQSRQDEPDQHPARRRYFSEMSSCGNF